jgi:two-component sensor histidine kinase/integral membrane sensor domain MASE1
MLQGPSQKARRRTPAIPASHSWAYAIGLAVAIGIAYFLSAQLSLGSLAEADGVARFWPAAGVSSGVLIAFGRDARLPVASGVIVATIIANIWGDRNLWSAIAFAFCNAGEALLIGWLIERYFGARFNLDRLHNVIGLVAAAVVATAASGIAGTVAYKLFHSPTASIWSTWQHWFASGVVGIIAVAPLIIGLAEAVREPPPRNEIIEGVVALLLLAAMTVIVVLLPPEPWKTVRPIALLFPILLWLAARCRPGFAAAAVFIVSHAIIWAMTFDRSSDFRIHAFPIGDRITGAQAAILIVALCEYLLAALLAERRQAEACQNLLIAELDHRVKNVLARVAAVVRHTRQRSGAADEFVDALDGRIQSIAAAHVLLSQSRWSGVSLADLIRHQLASYTTGANTMIRGQDVTLTSAQTQAVAMVIHELVTNAAKHGALSSPSGRVSVSWERNGAGATAILTITWRELGGSSIAAPVQSGYGLGLIRDLIPHELSGTVDLAFTSDGLCCKIEIPLRASHRGP